MDFSSSVATDRYDYRAWGEPRVILGNTTDNPYLYVGQLGYYAHWQDPALADMLHLGVRFYEPGVGRFISRDPIGYEGGLDLYAYVGNNPVVYTDPFGLRHKGKVRDPEKLRECLDDAFHKWRNCWLAFTVCVSIPYDISFCGLAVCGPPGWAGIVIITPIYEGVELVGTVACALEYRRERKECYRMYNP